MEIKFDFNDILIEPTILSNISSRTQCNPFHENGYLPLFTAPMDTVVSEKNLEIFQKNNIIPIRPRTSQYKKDGIWNAISLQEFKEIFIENKYFLNNNETQYFCIDIANGHMSQLIGIIKKAKEKYNDQLVLMIGNIANPKTFIELALAGAEFIRLGIGGGSGCSTSVHTGIGYPLASLIYDTRQLINQTIQSKEIRGQEYINITRAKIVADGGMKNYSDIIKALSLGVDFCMLGGILNKALESAGHTFAANKKFDGYTIPGDQVDQYNDDVKMAFKNGAVFYKKFRGMSTKEVQLHLGNELRSSEGVTRMTQVEYTLEGWVDNFKDYLRSAMSYTGKNKLEEFIGKVNFNLISQNSFNRFNK
jgi:GMP reductase